jgi:preprotein translocase subunit SecB
MQPSPLQLEGHHFTRIQISAREGAPDESQNKVECQLAYAVDNTNPRRHRVALTLRLSEFPDTTPAYTGEFEIVGFFAVVDAWPEEKIGQLITANGPSVLYGAVREMIITLTSRLAHGPIQIPTVRFPPLEEDLHAPKAKKVARKRAKATK